MLEGTRGGRGLDVERIVCSWCHAQNEPDATTCARCGAPLDVSNVVSDSGWRQAPRLVDLAEFSFGGGSRCQVTGSLVPVADVSLAAGDGIFFEAKTMLWKDEQLAIASMKVGGGLSRMLGGMPYVVITATGPGRIAFSRDAAGEVIVLPMDPSVELDARGHAFLAATQSISYSFVQLKGYTNLVHGDDGLYMDRFTTGQQAGALLLHGYGNVMERTLAAGEKVLIDPGGFLYKDSSVTMDVHQLDVKTGLARHGLYLAEMTGPGRVGIQSMDHHG